MMAAEIPYFWVAFVVGFAGLLPTALGAVRYYERRQEGSESDRDEAEDALEALRRRYANGELGEVGFERQLELLLETESLEDAQQFAGRHGGDADRERTRDQPDREPELDRER